MSAGEIVSVVLCGTLVIFVIGCTLWLCLSDDGDRMP